MRHLLTKDVGNETFEVTTFSQVFSQLCHEMMAYSHGQGLPCSIELTGFCQEMKTSVQEFRNALWGTNDMNANVTSVFSVAIESLLHRWGTIEDAMIKVKQYSNWRDVLSARILALFIELNYQLSDFPHMATQTDFQDKWTLILSYLGFARIMAERLGNCWLENIDLKLNSTHRVKHLYNLGFALWQISGAGTDHLSGSHAGIQALRNTQQCLFSHAVPALRLASRSVSSGLSMRICLLAIACLIYPLVMVSFKQMTEWIQNYAHSLKEKTEDLRRQRQLAEDLLHQMLPKSVAKQLRQHKHVEAESYEKVGGRKPSKPNQILTQCRNDALQGKVTQKERKVRKKKEK